MGQQNARFKVEAPTEAIHITTSHHEEESGQNPIYPRTMPKRSPHEKSQSLFRKEPVMNLEAPADERSQRIETSSIASSENISSTSNKYSHLLVDESDAPPANSRTKTKRQIHAAHRSARKVSGMHGKPPAGRRLQRKKTSCNGSSEKTSTTLNKSSVEEIGASFTKSRAKPKRNSHVKSRSFSRKVRDVNVKAPLGSRLPRERTSDNNNDIPIVSVRNGEDRFGDNYQDNELHDESDEDDPLVFRLEEIHQGIKEANEELHRKMFEFERSMSNQIQDAYTEGGVRMAEYLLRRQIVKSGLCVILTGKDVTPPTIDLLEHAYSRFHFEVIKGNFREVKHSLQEWNVDTIDFTVWHLPFALTDRGEMKFFEWLSEVETVIKLIPKVIFIPKQGFFEESTTLDIPNSIIVRSNSQSYFHTYSRVLQQHESRVDLQTVLKIVEDAEMKEGCMITTTAGTSAKIFFEAK